MYRRQNEVELSHPHAMTVLGGREDTATTILQSES